MAGRRAQIPSNLRAQWDETYTHTPYRDLPWFSPRPFPWLREAVEAHWLAPRTTILDIGCGAGTNAIYLAQSGFRVSGIDLAPGAIRAAAKRARRAGLAIDFRIGDALRLPYSRGFFGGLLDVGCFHTLPLKLRDSYARELARVLRPKGRYLLSWIAREFTGARGPPHRPSVEETTSAFEKYFLFLRTEFRAGWKEAPPAYCSLLERRSRRQPPPR